MRHRVCPSPRRRTDWGVPGSLSVAIVLNPANPSLRLNVAQLLFIKGDDLEANKQLQEALRLRLGDSAQLEAQFYELASMPIYTCARDSFSCPCGRSLGELP
jgi:hypothetical protein